MNLQRLHLAALTSLAVAQPLYQVVADAPAFLVAGGGGALDVVAIVVALSVVVPCLAVIVDRTVERRCGGWAHGLRSAMIGLFSAVVIAPAWAASQPEVSVVLLFVTAAGAGWLYSRFQAVRGAYSALIVALPVVPALFLGSAPVRTLWLPSPVSAVSAVDQKVPVIVVVFDELSLPSLLKDPQTLDAQRFPGFAALAARSTWFRNATAVIDDTSYAVPAILTGLRPAGVRAPTYNAYPQSLFTLLGRTHRFHVAESWTSLCPAGLCNPVETNTALRLAGKTADLAVIYGHVITPRSWAASWFPPLAGRWDGFGTPAWLDPGSREADDRNRQFHDALDACRPDPERPPLCYIHVALPHVPWEYLPSGRRYTALDQWWLPHGAIDARWTRDEWQVIQGWQRYLLQLAFADRLVSHTLEHLKRQSLLEQSLLVVTADHGVSFQPGQRMRWLDDGNLLELASVPLFIKLPGQRHGQVSDRNVESIDILPSLSEVLGARLSLRIDGQSVYSRSDARGTKQFFSDAGSRRVLGPARLPGLEAVLQRQRRWFGIGEPASRLYAIGPRNDLLGRTIPATVAVAEDVILDFEDEATAGTVNSGSEVVPARVVGRVSGLRNPDAIVAVALNDVIRATTRTFQAGSRAAFSAMLDESLFQNRANRIDAFLVASNGLQRLRRRGTQPFSLDSSTVPARLVASGKVLPLAEGVRGNLERAQRLFGGAALRGWATELDPVRPVEQVVAFAGGDLIYAGAPGVPRPDLATPGGAPPLAGFEVRVRLREPVPAASIAVFGVTGSGRAWELPREPWYVLSPQPSRTLLSGTEGDFDVGRGAIDGRIASVVGLDGGLRIGGWVRDTGTRSRPLRLVFFDGTRFVGQAALPARPMGLQRLFWKPHGFAAEPFDVRLTPAAPLTNLRTFVLAPPDDAEEIAGS